MLIAYICPSVILGICEDADRCNNLYTDTPMFQFLKKHIRKNRRFVIHQSVFRDFLIGKASIDDAFKHHLEYIESAYIRNGKLFDFIDLIADDIYEDSFNINPLLDRNEIKIQSHELKRCLGYAIHHIRYEIRTHAKFYFLTAHKELEKVVKIRFGKRTLKFHNIRSLDTDLDIFDALQI